MPFERRPREMHKATCGDCGNECEIPFEPRNDKPVYCNECFQNHKPERSERSGGRFGGRSGGGYGRNNRSGGRFGRDRPPREMHKATCGDCGNECEIPFEPRNDKPVYCDECFPNHKLDRQPGSRSGRGGFGRNNRSGGRFGRDRPPREMHKATCGDCGNECEIPFEPRNDKPVYCNECFPNHKLDRQPGSRSGRGGFGRNNRSGGRFGRDRPPREMHKATCGDCGNECEIPFEPRNDKPVYCNECFPNHKLDRREN